MALRRKGSAPWSATKEAGLSDAPVSGNPFVEGDEVKPVIDAGFIDEKGLWQINRVSDDQQFTFQDPDQAITPGNAAIIQGVNMLNHDLLIVAVKDSSGDDIDFSVQWRNDLVGATGPYTAPIFSDDGVNTGNAWHVNEYPGSGGLSGGWDEILATGNELATETWKFYKVIGLRGTLGQVYLYNGDGSDTGIISTAYLRLV